MSGLPCRDDAVLLLNPALGDRLLVGSTDQLLEAFTPPEEPTLQPARWLEVSEEERQRGLRLRICHSKVCDGKGREGERARPGQAISQHCSSLASDTGDLARARGLPGCGAVQPRAHPGTAPPAEQEAQPEPVPPQPRAGAVCVFPSHPALPARGLAAQRSHLPPAAPGAHQEADAQLQVGV